MRLFAVKHLGASLALSKGGKGVSRDSNRVGTFGHSGDTPLSYGIHFSFEQNPITNSTIVDCS
jgi:hypothetical protein